MSWWSWHEKQGPLKGPIKRMSDIPKISQQEREERARHRREWLYIDHGGYIPLYEEFRVCTFCGIHARQKDMRWTFITSWRCPAHYENDQI
jgi:hypothetical protein